VLQQIPLDGLIIVSSPQDLALMVVKKAVKMAEKLNVAILGLIENMSYVQCPECGKKIQLFGKGKSQEAAQKMDIPFLGSLPIDPVIARLCDEGRIEEYENENIEKITSFKILVKEESKE
jgi:Mrp family chromosome partitioning ATPase